VFGPPRERADAVALLRAAVEWGVDHIDTAQYYGPNVVNELIREALHPYPADLVLVSKVGARRDERGGVLADDEPEQLRLGIEENLRTLDLESLPVVNLRIMRPGGPDAFFDDQLAAMVSARDDGLIGSIGLSNVTIVHLLRALQFTEVACVQNAFHVANRDSEPVLDECARRGIAFVPFSPLGSDPTDRNTLLTAPAVVRTAARFDCTPAQVLLAWLLSVAPNVLLIPGSSSLHHLRENLDALDVHLDADAVLQLSNL
jgi:aryl-alcohol dehydrogenase-like predicted oxidoreductase